MFQEKYLVLGMRTVVEVVDVEVLDSVEIVLVAVVVAVEVGVKFQEACPGFIYSCQGGVGCRGATTRCL